MLSDSIGFGFQVGQVLFQPGNLFLSGPELPGKVARTAATAAAPATVMALPVSTVHGFHPLSILEFAHELINKSKKTT
jgi:hypothetical protein